MGARLVTLTPDFEGAHCWIYQRGARLAYNVGEGSPTIYHSIPHDFVLSCCESEILQLYPQLCLYCKADEKHLLLRRLFCLRE